MSTTHPACPLTAPIDVDAQPAREPTLSSQILAVTAGTPPRRRGAGSRQGLEAGVLGFICVAVAVVAIGLVFDLTVLLTWVAAIYTELIIPLTTVALIREIHPSWANFPASRLSRQAGRRGEQ